LAEPIVMPSFGMYTAEGILVGWLQPSGARVTAGDPILLIETEKATQEVVAPADGILHQAARIGERLTEQEVVGFILADGEVPPLFEGELVTATGQPFAPRRAATRGQPAAEKALPERPPGGVIATPAARKLARTANIDLTRLTGSGPGGRIVEADVEAAIHNATAPAATPARRWSPLIPATISPEAQAFLATFPEPAAKPFSPAADDIAGWARAHAGNEAEVRQLNADIAARYKPQLVQTHLGGVPVLDIRPQSWSESRQILVYVHGGGYVLHSAASSLISSVPVADDTGLRVCTVDYTCAPAAGYREIVSQVANVVAALRAAGHDWADIALFGDSAGAAIACGAILKLRDEGLGLPAALVLWSPWADIAEIGDSYATLRDADLVLRYEQHLKSAALAYAPATEHRHPWVSPVYADYRAGFPPTLIQGGTKEIFLSNCVRLYQALDTAGQTAKLDLYEGMPHVFQAFNPDLPESKLARQKMKAFLNRYLSGGH